MSSIARRWRAFFGFLLAVGATLAGAFAYAPQVPVLAQEGFPAPVWPARGRFDIVRGGSEAMGQEAISSLPAAAFARFNQSGGRALLVDDAGDLKFEGYGDGLGPDDLLNSYSLVKSLVGVLVLKAVADGRIERLDTSLTVYLGPNAPDVTIGEALTMTSGLAVTEPRDKPVDDADFSPFGPLARIHAFGIADNMAGLQVNPDLRGVFSYQSVNTGLLGLLLERVYGQSLADRLSETIWRPAGAEDAYWRAYPRAEGVSAYCCLYARPRDWVRVGRFLLDNGTAEAPLLPEAMWRAFLLPELAPQVRRAGAYGQHIRHDVLDREGAGLNGPFAYFMGHEGQVVYLLPDKDAVVVRFGARPQLLHSTLYELFAP